MTASTAPVDVKSYLKTCRASIDRVLDAGLPPPETEPSSIHRAMRYTVMAGGKRIRPILAMAAAEACGADPQPLLRQFAALELIHTYSLVHDDLPALDNDELRRGLPTAHVAFNEAIAILAGDALLTEAFTWLADHNAGLSPLRQLRGVALVARAVDSQGMIGGQVEDIESEHLNITATNREELMQRLGFIHKNKTGRLLTASVVLGGLLGGGDEDQLGLLERYGSAVGLAFQIVDDLLDEEETAETLGKTAGKDLAQGKLTYPALVGRDKAREEIASLLDSALRSADMIGGRVNYLGPIARYLCARRS